MNQRISRKDVTFRHPFVLDGIAGEMPPGIYEVELVEELLDGLSFPAFRLVSASVVLPLNHGLHSYQLIRILPALVNEAIADAITPARTQMSKQDGEKSL